VFITKTSAGKIVTVKKQKYIPQDVDPGALRLVIKSLHGSLNDNTWQPTDVPLHLRQASNSQTKIGWQHLVYGRMAKALTQQLAEDPNKTTTPTAVVTRHCVLHRLSSHGSLSFVDTV
jgi:hypothetical protein